jgi:hypothetical protein
VAGHRLMEDCRGLQIVHLMPYRLLHMSHMKLFIWERKRFQVLCLSRDLVATYISGHLAAM